MTCAHFFRRYEHGAEYIVVTCEACGVSQTAPRCAADNRSTGQQCKTHATKGGFLCSRHARDIESPDA